MRVATVSFCLSEDLAKWLETSLALGKLDALEK